MFHSCALQAGCKFADLPGTFGFLRSVAPGTDILALPVAVRLPSCKSMSNQDIMRHKVPGNWHVQFTSASN